LLISLELFENGFVLIALNHPFGNKATKFWMGFETKLS